MEASVGSRAEPNNEHSAASESARTASPTTSACDPSIHLAVVDPDTHQPWPLRFDTDGTARYLQVAHNLPIAKLTLVRQRSKGVGIRWKYLGQKPIAERTEIDRFVREDALRDNSPLKAGAQARADRRRQERQTAASRRRSTP
jgi:hypothetical protein